MLALAEVIMDVQLVNVETNDGVRLDGYLRAPTPSSASTARAVDVVICHHGVGSNFYAPSFFDAIGDELVANGTAVLRVNNRGHDQAYQLQQRRLGAAYEVIDDCRKDFSAWLDFAAARAFRRIAIWGHSLGAVKTVYFLSVAHDPRVLCAVASSPPRFDHQAYLASPNGGSRFQADIDRAQSLLAAGQPEALFEALIPQQRAFSARTFLDKYGPNAPYDYFAHLPKTAIPLLLTLGSLEREDISFAPLASRGPTMSAEWPNVSYALIDGADHSYTTRTERLWQIASAWLKRVAALAAVA
jgi:pimeloyl-ACP methyl ester carboxylesterase